MSKKKAIRQLFTYGIALIIGGFWALFVFFSCVLNFLKNPRQKWSYDVRKERPPCLESTEIWTHNLVSLQHDDIKLHYVSAGASHKPLMVLLHGFPEVWYAWRHQLKYFKNDYRVVAISMRGYGDSDAPPGVYRYTIEKLVADVAGVVRSLGARDCILVGHDWGGAVAWSTAIAHPELVSRLIILNCPHPGAFHKYIHTSMKQFLMSWYMFFFQWPLLAEYFMTRFDLDMIRRAAKLCKSDDDDGNLEESLLYYFSQPGAFTGPINYYRAAFRYGRLTAPPAAATLQTLSMPVLIVWGTDDRWLNEPLAAMSAEYCADVMIKKIVGGNHFIQQHKPKDVNAFMEEFLNSK